MADLYFYAQEEDGDEGDGVFGDTDVTMNPDEPPVLKMEKYAESDNIFNRRMVARQVLETLRVVTDDASDIAAVLKVMNKLADDGEPNVRAELMEQVPHIAMYCQELKGKLAHVVPQYLLPMVVKFLTDFNNQVRKTSQAALLVLLEQGLVEKEDVRVQVCPVIIKLTEAESIDDYRTEAVALLSKMAPLIGKEMAEQIFLERFAALCIDPLFHVREVCAANFGDFSTVVGSKSTEEVLLPKFFYLCEDVVWGVRKACADAFMPVSCVCSSSVRHSELSPLFINLLRDQSRWVRMAAFQALGHFISTFADPSITGLLNYDNGEIVITDPEQLSLRLNELEEQRATEAMEEQKRNRNEQQQHHSQEETQESKSDNSNSSSNDSLVPPLNCDAATVIESTDSKIESENENIKMDIVDPAEDNNGDKLSEGERLIFKSDDSGPSPEESRAKSYLTHNSSPSDTDVFNNFQFWREPLIDLGGEGDHTHQSETIDDGVDDDKVVECLTGGLREEKEKNNDEDDDDDLANLGSLTGEGEDGLEDLYAATSVASIAQDINSKSDTSGDVKTVETKITCPTITYQVFNDMTDSSENTSMEMFRPSIQWNSNQPVNLSENLKESHQGGDPTAENISTFDPLEMYKKGGKLDPPDPALPKSPPATYQNIVPQLLIDHYISMTDPSRVQTVDNDIARHCAFSLPAVALTLGRSNWPQLRDTYKALASDMQWKVRRTLASSIHELGIILGDEAQDLIPIFNGFLKDLDEVRIGLLKHLADFLKLLKAEDRLEYLPRLSEFLKMDNERNWRFRDELAEQIAFLVDLYPPADVFHHLTPIAKKLIKDKVSSVRLASVEVHVIIVRCLKESDNPSLLRILLAELVDDLALADRWIHRQTYATLAHRIFLKGAVEHSQFAQDILPHLVELSWDKVPNVRLVVARALYNIQQTDYFSKEANPSQERLQQAVAHLAEDRDKDVRVFFNPIPESTEFFGSDGEGVNDVSSLPV